MPGIDGGQVVPKGLIQTHLEEVDLSLHPVESVWSWMMGNLSLKGSRGSWSGSGHEAKSISKTSAPIGRFRARPDGVARPDGMVVGSHLGRQPGGR